MAFSRIELRNFRCFDALTIDISSKSSLFYGKNGCGKTSILESIYVASCGRSFRTSNLESLIKNGTNSFKIKAYDNNSGSILEINKKDLSKFLDEINNNLINENEKPSQLSDKEIYSKGLASIKKGNYKQAILKFQKILKKYPNLSSESKSRVYLMLSMSHGYLNKHYAALGFINKAIDLDPTFGALYTDRATTKNYLGDKKGYCLDLQISMDLGFGAAEEFFNKWCCN